MEKPLPPPVPSSSSSKAIAPTCPPTPTTDTRSYYSPWGTERQGLVSWPQGPSPLSPQEEGPCLRNRSSEDLLGPSRSQRPHHLSGKLSRVLSSPAQAPQGPPQPLELLCPRSVHTSHCPPLSPELTGSRPEETVLSSHLLSTYLLWVQFPSWNTTACSQAFRIAFMPCP